MLVGQTFGRLTVIADDGIDRHRKKRWKCRCACGSEISVPTSRLLRGRIQSCGCAKADATKARWESYRIPKFWARVDRKGADECWNWQGPVDRLGYGVLGFAGKHWRSHRLAYALSIAEIPEGQHVLHTCDNRRCCNPAHLWVGDHADNMLDMALKGRRVGINAGQRNGRAKFTQEQAEEIRSRYRAGGVSQQDLADEYGVSQFAVSQIVLGRRYTT